MESLKSMMKLYGLYHLYPERPVDHNLMHIFEKLILVEHIQNIFCSSNQYLHSIREASRSADTDCSGTRQSMGSPVCARACVSFVPLYSRYTIKSDLSANDCDDRVEQASWYGAFALPTLAEIDAGRCFFRRTCHQELQQPRLDSCPAHVTSAPVVGNLRPPVWLGY